jgi:putative acetyltransferase
VIEKAFRTAPHADGTEHLLVGRLRDAGGLAVSLVAEAADGKMLGHIAFSPVTIGDGTQAWYGLAPVSVVSERQGEGLGTALIDAGLGRLRQLDAGGCVVLGEPAFYSRFGFANDAALTFPGPPPEYFQRLVLRGDAPRGEVRYSPAFG